MKEEKTTKRRESAALQSAFCLLLVCAAPGCGSDGLVPVSGNVLLDDRPLAAGSVVFHPDSTQGNMGQHIPAGEVRDGKYELYTNRRKGAPPGAYRVVVIADNFSGGNAPEKGATAEMPKSLLPARYGDKQRTPLAVRVERQAAERAYDLKVSSK